MYLTFSSILTTWFLEMLEEPQCPQLPDSSDLHTFRASLQGHFPGHSVPQCQILFFSYLLFSGRCDLLLHLERGGGINSLVTSKISSVPSEAAVLPLFRWAGWPCVMRQMGVASPCFFSPASLA